jgi:hypothetical protein
MKYKILHALAMVSLVGVMVVLFRTAPPTTQAPVSRFFPEALSRPQLGQKPENWEFFPHSQPVKSPF